MSLERIGPSVVIAFLCLEEWPSVVMLLVNNKLIHFKLQKIRYTALEPVLAVFLLLSIFLGEKESGASEVILNFVC